MPIRLPFRHRIEGPKQFRRRSPPSPQATRLMKISLGASLLFILVLAVVFVPSALRYDRPSIPAAVLALRSSSPFVVEVVRVNLLKPLAEFQGELNVTGVNQSDRNVLMNPLSVGSWPSPPFEIITFADVDGDGRLSVGDTFTIRPQPGYSAYLLLVFHQSAYVNPTAPCPCAAARIQFP